MATVIAPLMGVQYSDQWFNNFDLRELVGQYCTVGVEHFKKSDGNLAARVTTLTPWVKGVDKPKGVNEDFYYAVREHGVWTEEWLRLPFWLQETVFKWGYTDFEQIAHVSKWTKDSKPAFDASSIRFLSYTLWKEEKERRIASNQAANQQQMQGQASEPGPQPDFSVDPDDDDLPF
jgi:hypothetical protein